MNVTVQWRNDFKEGDIGYNSRSINLTTNISEIESNYIKKDGSASINGTINTTRQNIFDSVYGDRYTSIITSSNALIGSIFSVNPIPTSNGDSKIRFFRDVNTNGTRYFELNKGDGTSTVTYRIDASTGDIVSGGDYSKNLNLNSNDIYNIDNLEIDTIQDRRFSEDGSLNVRYIRPSALLSLGQVSMNGITIFGSRLQSQQLG